MACRNRHCGIMGLVLNDSLSRKMESGSNSPKESLAFLISSTLRSRRCFLNRFGQGEHKVLWGRIKKQRKKMEEGLSAWAWDAIPCL